VSESKDEYSFLNNIDNKILVAMVILSSALTLFAIVINIAIRHGETCTRAEYIYCGEDESHGHGSDDHGAPEH